MSIHHNSCIFALTIPVFLPLNHWVSDNISYVEKCWWQVDLFRQLPATTDRENSNWSTFTNIKIHCNFVDNWISSYDPILEGVVLGFSTLSAQMFQPTATVATSWWASSFLREYTKDKSPQLELEVSPHGYSSDLDTNNMFTSLQLCIARLLLFFISNKDYFEFFLRDQNLPFFTYKAQLSTIKTNMVACTSAICWRNLEPQLSHC